MILFIIYKIERPFLILCITILKITNNEHHICSSPFCQKHFKECFETNAMEYFQQLWIWYYTRHYGKTAQWIEQCNYCI